MFLYIYINKFELLTYLWLVQITLLEDISIIFKVVVVCKNYSMIRRIAKVRITEIIF